MRCYWEGVLHPGARQPLTTHLSAVHLDELGHAVAHPLGDLDDRLLLCGLELAQHAQHRRELLQHVLLAAVAVACTRTRVSLQLQ